MVASHERTLTSVSHGFILAKMDCNVCPLRELLVHPIQARYRTHTKLKPPRCIHHLESTYNSDLYIDVGCAAPVRFLRCVRQVHPWMRANRTTNRHVISGLRSMRDIKYLCSGSHLRSILFVILETRAFCTFRACS